MTSWVSFELVGSLAGSITCFAGLPRAIHVLRHSKVAKGESVSRNVCFVAGNALWVVYGIGMSAAAISLMCSVNVTLNGIILVATLASRRGVRDDRD